jgi:4-hydroxy-tetrahydrodipicolinate synthase
MQSFAGEKSMFHGSMVALITPMFKDGTIDFNSLSNLIEWHIENQTDALVVLGTTGESATLNFAERQDVLKRTVEQVGERVPVIAGTGTNSTAETIKLTQHAMEAGVDACLVVTPYYNKPTQEGLFLHYREIASAVPIPLILYNVPGRTACDLLPETVGRLSNITNIIGLKEATGDISRVKELLAACPRKIDLYSGDDETSLDFMLAGGKGVISVTANVAPKMMHDMCSAALGHKLDRAKDLQNKLMPLHKNLFIEPNPIPTKWVLSEMGKTDCGIRLPLTWLTEKHQLLVREAMKQVGIHS